MKRKIIIGGIVVLALMAILVMALKSEFYPAVSTPTQQATSTDQVWECNGDAKTCPDGSSLGRTGPRCEFPACPGPDATFARIETYLGGRDGGLNLTLRPQKVISDSRCAPGLQCVWAGTVEVQVIIETKVGHGELVFKLGEPRTIGDLRVTLVEVRPSSAEETKNPESGYWFVFEARKIGA